MDKRKICFVITSKIHYARSKLILEELKMHPEVDLQVVVGASALLSKYGDVLQELKEDGYTVDEKILMTIEGGSRVAMAKTTGIGIAEFATALDRLQPDVVIVRGDRYEVLAAATAAAYLNIPVAHIEGGDVTGTIDESVRHAITKLSHIHFPTNEVAKNRILRMGEDPRYVFHVGCPGIEMISKQTFAVDEMLINYLGVGANVDTSVPYIIVMQHPVTTAPDGENARHVIEILSAVRALGIQALWFWPNVDAGTDEISKEIRRFREVHGDEAIRFLKYLPTEQFLGLLRGASCLVGNSSAGIKEAGFFGVPVVNVGNRQEGRIRGPHVLDVPPEKEAILDAAKRQVAHGRYERDNSYYLPGTSKNIAKVLVDIDLYTQKRFHD